MNMFARFDENPAMTLRVIKETKRYGRTDARTDNVKTVYPLQTKFAGGIIIKWMDKKIFTVLVWFFFCIPNQLNQYNHVLFLSPQEEVEKIKAQGASEEEQRQLLEQHERDLQNLLNKMAADKLRQQSMLQERLKKKKEEKLRAKQDELINNADDAKRELDVRQQSKLQRMKADEVQFFFYQT